MTNIQPSTAFTPTDDAMLLHELRQLIKSCGRVSRHDLAIVAITACIDAGKTTRAQIVGVLRRLNFKPSHIAITLDRETGSDPVRHRWHRSDDGTYSNLP